MLKSLKFVQGGVAKKDFVAAMTHFRIEGGFVRSFNGQMALSSPIPFNIDCVPNASQLVKAIANCNDTVALSMTPTGRLKVQSGSFKAFIDCLEGETPHVLPEGDSVVNFDGVELLRAFESLLPFVGNDASRPWSNGILIKEQSAFATNNVCLVEYWFGSPFPFPINIPLSAIKEMLRIKDAPAYAQIDHNSITFHYSGERWLRTQLFDTDWPDLQRVLNVPDANPVELEKDLFDGLETIKPFVDKMGRVYLKDGRVFTHEGDEEGASFNINDHSLQGVYNLEMLMLLKGVAKSADFTLYPKPCPFYNDRLRGVIIGMRL